MEKQSTEQETKVEEKEEETEEIPVVPSIKNIDDEKVVTKLSFNNNDSVLTESNSIENVEAPKTIERLEEISTSRALERKLAEQDEDDEDDDERIKISSENIDLTGFDVLDEPTKLSNLVPQEEEIKLDFEQL